MSRAWFALLAAIIALVPLLALGGGTAAAQSRRDGAVYTLTNAATGNAVAIFERGPNGALEAAGTFATGGRGSGAGLGSQGALVLSRDGRWLFAVNAGSNDVSAIAVHGDDLRLASVAPSGGEHPISLTVHGDLLYVLNGGGSGNISALRVGNDGRLTPIAGSTRPLSGPAVGPAQVQFSPRGDLLVVTEKATNQIVTYAVGADGLAGAPVAHPSAGATPFGFAFGKRGDLIVSEAFGGAAGASAVSSYRVERDGGLRAISPSVATGQTAACWIVVSDNGRFAYTTNAGSGSVSGYQIAPDGSLTLLDANGRTGVTGDGSTPIDMGLSNGSRYLYTLNAGSHTISGFRVADDGHLSPIGGAAVPAGAVGLAVR